jgi:hypothetical protein
MSSGYTLQWNLDHFHGEITLVMCSYLFNVSPSLGSKLHEGQKWCLTSLLYPSMGHQTHIVVLQYLNLFVFILR